jgi:hypothetical protein
VSRKTASLSPVEALHVLAENYPGDPIAWLEQCALAKMDVSGDRDELLAMWQAAAERDLVGFKNSWLSLSPAGRDAVISLLKRGPSAAIGRAAPLQPTSQEAQLPPLTVGSRER